MLQHTTSLALRALLKTAAARAGLDHARPVITGLSPAAVALHVAVSAEDAPVLFVVPTDADVERMIADVRFFLANVAGGSPADAERSVRPFPSQEVDPYRDLAPHLEVASARAAALHGLATGTVRVVVASARALLPRLSDPHRIAAA